MRLFTVQQAEELIPHIRAEMEKLQPAYKILREGWERICNEHSLDVADPLVGELCLDEPELRVALEQVNQSLKQIHEYGAECKGIEQGLFDFPCLFEDRLAYLCWRQDEDQINHWHELDAGYAGRKELMDAESKDSSHYIN